MDVLTATKKANRMGDNLPDIDCLVSLPANIKLNPSGQRKLLDWIKFCFEIGWSKEHVIKLKDFWLETHNEYGNLIKAS